MLANTDKTPKIIGDNPSFNFKSIQQATNYLRVVQSLMRRYSIRFQTLYELFVIVDMYREGNVVTPYRICKISESENFKNFRSSLRRIDMLLEKGLVEVIGIGTNGAKLIIPSKKALEELSELCK